MAESLKASKALVAVLNIRNAALDHKEHCEHNCTVSLIGLRHAAEMLLALVPSHEQNRAEQYISEMPGY